MALNNSVTKQQFAFSKSSRFPSLKSNTANISGTVFDKPSDFNRTRNFANATTHGFGAHYPRFKNHNVSMRQGALPSSNTY